jgi:putative transposase
MEGFNALATRITQRENGFCESFNSKMRDAFLNGEIFYSLKELRVLAERRRKHYNTARPHSSLGCRLPAPEAWLASTARREEKLVASLPDPLAALSCIDLNSEIGARH